MQNSFWLLSNMSYSYVNPSEGVSYQNMKQTGPVFTTWIKLSEKVAQLS